MMVMMATLTTTALQRFLYNIWPYTLNATVHTLSSKKRDLSLDVLSSESTKRLGPMHRCEYASKKTPKPHHCRPATTPTLPCRVCHRCWRPAPHPPPRRGSITHLRARVDGVSPLTRFAVALPITTSSKKGAPIPTPTRMPTPHLLPTPTPTPFADPFCRCFARLLFFRRKGLTG